jgi:small subunit ribosomal protein S20
MPQHKQFEKSLKLNEESRLRNKAAMSKMRTIVKKVLSAPTKEEAQTLFRAATSVIDSTARKGVIKKETAARKKSRLSKFIAKMQAQ